MYFALFYDYVPDVLERRKPHRDGHLALAAELNRKGTLLFAGAFDPPNGALFVFQGTQADVEEFVRRDPYVKNGVVTGHRILPWHVAVGGAQP
ncbi:YciI family protein [Anaeromyxobacter oryzisoli]|uniref:YciI family protein n=1 Tax=Anaeromyxobacter oryzisoli TaxID=2925408 RepID=UPI001F57F173|nr:YciI family protein [Anaeromyxobacter sp. SG63]